MHTNASLPQRIACTCIHSSYLTPDTTRAGVHNRSWEMPCSGTEDVAMLTSSSNVGEPGVWVFQVDGTDIIPACPNEGLLHNSGNNTVIFSCICFTFTY